MESTFVFIVALIILWALEIRFREYKKTLDELNDLVKKSENRLKKIEEDMVNMYLRKG